jgi:hypothetical protein
MVEILDIVEDEDNMADITIDLSNEEWDSLLEYGKSKYTCESDEEYIRLAFIEAIENATSNNN